MWPLLRLFNRPTRLVLCTSLPARRFVMAPSRTSSKRKVDADTDTEEQDASQQTNGSQKKLKRTATTAFESDQPRNKEMPSEISIPAKSEGTFRLAAWNVCGFAASLKKVWTRRFSFHKLTFRRVSVSISRQKILTYYSSRKQRFVDHLLPL